MNWHEQTILLTGGTGSFGKAFTKTMLNSVHPRKLIIFSRDELKQSEMKMQFDDSSIRYFIGDVRDKDRLKRAMNGVDTVVHAAALKQVPACEYNPLEAVKTNIMGAANVIDAALDTGVRRVLALSTDKAVNPINLYGATKLVAEKLFIQANVYSGHLFPKFSCVRYGNVVGSRGSVIPIFQHQRESGVITLTDDRMTRFWIILSQVVEFTIDAIELMHGGEVFVPKIPSMRIVDVAQVLAPDCTQKVIGIRPGEKLHEVLISKDESRMALEFDNMYIIKPPFPWWPPLHDFSEGGRTMPDSSEYSSNNNPVWLSNVELASLIGV